MSETPEPLQPPSPPPRAPDPASSAAAAAPATATIPAPSVPPPPPAAAPTMSGRRYGFLCSYCSSRLEAVESMAGQTGTCPTCGEAVVIPILDYRGRLIDPTSGKVLKQDPHPVHAYAAAGKKAPQIVPVNGPDDRAIQCPRCNRTNPLSANNCLGCGLPFTMEGTAGDAVSGTNTWAVASLVLGIVSIAGGMCFVIPPILAIIFGAIAMKSNNQASGTNTGQGLAITGIILGTIGLVIAIIFYSRIIHP